MRRRPLRRWSIALRRACDGSELLSESTANCYTDAFLALRWFSAINANQNVTDQRRAAGLRATAS